MPISPFASQVAAALRDIPHDVECASRFGTRSKKGNGAPCDCDRPQRQAERVAAALRVTGHHHAIGGSVAEADLLALAALRGEG